MKLSASYMGWALNLILAVTVVKMHFDARVERDIQQRIYEDLLDHYYDAQRTAGTAFENGKRDGFIGGSKQGFKDANSNWCRAYYGDRVVKTTKRQIESEYDMVCNHYGQK